MSGNKQLRLILFTQCDRRCDGCCNKDFDIPNLPVCKDYSLYSRVMLTGGEPMLRPNKIYQAIYRVREQNPTAEIILYTARTSRFILLADILDFLNGITVTLHEEKDVAPFTRFNAYLRETRSFLRRSKRLNVFFPFHDIDGWIVKDNIEWIKNSPLPPNEELMRYEQDV